MTDLKSQLPAIHGTQVNYRCQRKYFKQDDNAAAVCENGTITFPKSSPCDKIGRNVFKSSASTCHYIIAEIYEK
jgi:hypothetical protein